MRIGKGEKSKEAAEGQPFYSSETGQVAKPLIVQPGRKSTDWLAGFGCLHFHLALVFSLVASPSYQENR